MWKLPKYKPKRKRTTKKNLKPSSVFRLVFAWSPAPSSLAHHLNPSWPHPPQRLRKPQPAARERGCAFAALPNHWTTTIQPQPVILTSLFLSSDIYACLFNRRLSWRGNYLLCLTSNHWRYFVTNQQGASITQALDHAGFFILVLGVNVLDKIMLHMTSYISLFFKLKGENLWPLPIFV